MYAVYASWKMRKMDWADCIGRRRVVSWVAKQLMPSRQVVLLWGDANFGKGTYAYDIRKECVLRNGWQCVAKTPEFRTSCSSLCALPMPSPLSSSALSFRRSPCRPSLRPLCSETGLLGYHPPRQRRRDEDWAPTVPRIWGVYQFSDAHVSQTANRDVNAPRSMRWVGM